MELSQGIHLCYCTNVHPAETWPETLAALEQHTLPVRDRVAPGRRFAIGLRLSDAASRELCYPDELERFADWLDKRNCYVFTINGFPFGGFHDRRVKENVFQPDWSSPERLEYTQRLADILSRLLPNGVEGSVSTLPGSFKPFGIDAVRQRAIRDNLMAAASHMATLGKPISLALEPEPLGLFENSDETRRFFECLIENAPNAEVVRRHLTVNYDSCHMAVEFERATEALATFLAAGIRVGKVHVSNALGVIPSRVNRRRLWQFCEPRYLHQVVARSDRGELRRFLDLDVALNTDEAAQEWRIHFHVPLHTPASWFEPTSGHIEELFDCLAADPTLCRQLEIETYTWDVLPAPLRSATVEEQIAREYEWCIEELRVRRIAS
jgi:sugar phosphate isomerase/epimerase